jgi:hypothetical protein
MKRVAGTLLVVFFVLLAPMAAFAQDGGSGLNPPQGPSVGGAGGSTGAPGIAFTGAETLQLVLLALALVAVGTMLLVMTRRRRAGQVGTSS